MRNLSSTLVMENGLYCDQLDNREDRDQNMRKDTARNIVMISLACMKLHFISIDVQRLQNEDIALKENLGRLRDNLLSCKGKARLVEAERTELENKEVLLTNTKLLKDYTETSRQLSLEVRNNEKLRKCLGRWWEGLQREK